MTPALKVVISGLPYRRLHQKVDCRPFPKQHGMHHIAIWYFLIRFGIEQPCRSSSLVVIWRSDSMVIRGLGFVAPPKTSGFVSTMFFQRSEAMKLLSVLILGVVVCCPILPDLGAFGGDNCTGNTADLTCASAVPMESCDDSAKLETGGDQTKHRYEGFIPTTNKCSDKNPGTSCDGEGTKPDDGCTAA